MANREEQGEGAMLETMEVSSLEEQTVVESKGGFYSEKAILPAVEESKPVLVVENAPPEAFRIEYKNAPFLVDGEEESEEIEPEAPKPSCPEIQRMMELAADLSTTPELSLKDEDSEEVREQKYKEYQELVKRKQLALNVIRRNTVSFAIAEAREVIKALQRIIDGESVEPFDFRVDFVFSRVCDFLPANVEEFAGVVAEAKGMLAAIDEKKSDTEQRMHKAQSDLKNPDPILEEIQALREAEREAIIAGTGFADISAKIKTLSGKVEKIHETNGQSDKVIEVLTGYLAELDNRKAAAISLVNRLEVVLASMRAHVMAAEVNALGEQYAQKLKELSDILEEHKFDAGLIRFPSTVLDLQRIRIPTRAGGTRIIDIPRIENHIGAVSDNGHMVNDTTFSMKV